ncbi:hypothetical protein [Metabacillus litoralis]|nr:hypothetical protein [Metabacillus litoralis]
MVVNISIAKTVLVKGINLEIEYVLPVVEKDQQLVPFVKGKEK